MQSLYIIVAGAGPTPAQFTRAAALSCAVTVGDPTGLVTVFPSAVVTSTAPAVAPVVIADNTGQATLVAVQAAQAAATTAETTLTTNAATITTNVKARQATIQAWIAANPGGAVLTAGQTLVLAQMLNGLCNLLLAEYGSTSGT
jgi:hypothetical protein